MLVVPTGDAGIHVLRARCLSAGDLGTRATGSVPVRSIGGVGAGTKMGARRREGFHTSTPHVPGDPSGDTGGHTEGNWRVGSVAARGQFLQQIPRSPDAVVVGCRVGRGALGFLLM